MNSLWVFTATAIQGVQHRNFGLFFGSYMMIFLLVGAGNGSTYKMIPAIFRAKSAAAPMRSGDSASVAATG